MAASTYSVTTGSDLSALRRYIQAGIFTAAQFGVEEVDLINKLDKFTAVPSQRSVTYELDFLRTAQVASIPEGGKEARPSISTAITATVTWIFLNKRATMSRTSEIIQQQFGTRGNLVSDMKWYGKKFTQALRAKMGEMFYGFSTGTVAKVSSVSTDDLILKDLYGISGLGSTSHNRRVVDQFFAGTAGDAIAALNPSGPAIRGAPGIITAITRSSNTVTCTASGMTGVAADDLIVYANNIENTTLAGGTERSLNWVGLLDGLTSTSVHSVSGATYAPWNTGLADTGGGRFTGIKLMKMKQAIENNGGGSADTVIWANGVKFDVVSQLQAGLRFADAYGMEMDGEPKAKGITFFTSRRVPDGYAIMLDKSDSVKKWQIVPEPDSALSADDLYKLQDDSGSLLSIDYPCALCWTNRANTAYASGLTQA